MNQERGVRMSDKDVLGAFLLVNNPIVLSEEEIKDVQKAIKQLLQENKQLQQKDNIIKEVREKIKKQVIFKAIKY